MDNKRKSRRTSQEPFQTGVHSNKFVIGVILMAFLWIVAHEGFHALTMAQFGYSYDIGTVGLNLGVACDGCQTPWHLFLIAVAPYVADIFVMFLYFALRYRWFYWLMNIAYADVMVNFFFYLLHAENNDFAIISAWQREMIGIIFIATGLWLIHNRKNFMRK